MVLDWIDDIRWRTSRSTGLAMDKPTRAARDRSLRCIVT